MPTSAAPRHPRSSIRRLDWGRSFARFKQFFDLFDYDTFNARQVADENPDEVIKYRRANLRSTAQTIFRLGMEAAKKRARPGVPIRFALLTRRTSLATLLDRTPRTIDRHLATLRLMGFVEERKHAGRGLELVLSEALFVFLDNGEPRHTPPAPPASSAASVPPCAPEGPSGGPTTIAPAPTGTDEAVEVPAWLREAAAKGERAARMRQLMGQKNGDSSPPGPSQPQS